MADSIDPGRKLVHSRVVEPPDTETHEHLHDHQRLLRADRDRVRDQLLAAVGGIVFLPLDPWQRLFLGISVLFMVSSAFSLAKVIRDQQEASTVRVRLDEARVEKLLAEHDPYATIS